MSSSFKRAQATDLVGDPNPTLSAPLKTNGNAIEGSGAGVSESLLLAPKSDFSGEPSVQIKAGADWDSSGDGAYIEAVSDVADATLVLRAKGAGNVTLYDNTGFNFAAGPLISPRTDANGTNKTFVTGNGTSLLHLLGTSGAAGNQQYLSIFGGKFNSAGQPGPYISVDSDTALLGNGDLGIETAGNQLTLGGLIGSTNDQKIQARAGLAASGQASLTLQPQGTTGEVKIEQADNTSGLAAKLSATGADANVDLEIKPKGTGIIKAGSDIGVADGDGLVSDSTEYLKIETNNRGGLVTNSTMIGATGQFEIYSNTNEDASGTYDPSIALRSDGAVWISTDSTKTRNEIRLTADGSTDGCIVASDFIGFDGLSGGGAGDGTTTFNWSGGNKRRFTFGPQNETFTFNNPQVQGLNKTGSMQLILIQDSVGGRTVTWPANVKWPGGTAPTLSTAANAIDIVSFLFDGDANVYYGAATLDFQ